MSNRLDTYTRECIAAIFADGRWMYTKEREWKRDLTRLLTQMEARSHRCVTTDLPAMQKHLDRCLDEGFFTRYGGFLGRPKYPEDQLPKFLRQVFLRIFHPHGEILGNPCTESVLWLRTLLSFAKKIRIDCGRSNTLEEIKRYFKLEEELRSPDLDWDCDDLFGDDARPELLRGLHLRDFQGEHDLFERAPNRISDIEVDHLQRCFDIVSSQFGLPPHMCGERTDTVYIPRHGPGAVAAMPAVGSKYRFDNWPAKLQALFPRDYYALPSFGQGFSSDRESSVTGSGVGFGLNHELFSRLIAVPKTQEKPRLIAAEPIEHQWMQQYLMRVLDDRMKATPLARCINLRDQSPNQRMALKGSADGSYATVDLSEASDRLTCALVERFWRCNPHFLEALHAVRTRALSYKSGSYVNHTILKKYAPMGSAITFPLQSIVFATIGLAATLTERGLRPTIANMKRISPKVRVFGDDIIVENQTLGVLTRYLHFLGLKVNTSKTFSGRNFRESCGMDAFRGVCVTPPRILEVPNGTLVQYPSLVETSNNFHKKGFWHTARYISSLLTQNHLVPVSRDPGYSIALFSFVGDSLNHLRRRRNEDLQREEVRVLKTSTTSREGRMGAGERVMQYFTENPNQTPGWKSGYSVSRTVKVRPGWVPVIR